MSVAGKCRKLVCNRIVTRHARLGAGPRCRLPASHSPTILAGVTEAWVHRYSNVVSNSVDQAAKVVADAAGDTIVTGTTGRAA